jgi:acid phosphatase (class A)
MMLETHQLARKRGFFALALTLSLSACATTDSARTTDEVPEIRPGILQGYLPAEAMPNSLDLVPPPPADGSSAKALDEAVSRASLKLRDSSRWELAAEDNNLMFPRAAGTFSCAVGAPITEAATPHLYMVLRRSLADAGLSTYTAKNHYTRQRPFLVNGEATCVSEEEQSHLIDDGSYPSGHTAVGWAWALILASVAPDRADAIFARGRAFGQSRVVCNVHWQSDVIEGRFMGAAAVARLQANTQFQADLAAGAEELAKVRQRGDAPARDCDTEAAAMAEFAPGAPWPAGG